MNKLDRGFGGWLGKWMTVQDLFGGLSGGLTVQQGGMRWLGGLGTGVCLGCTLDHDRLALALAREVDSGGNN